MFFRRPKYHRFEYLPRFYNPEKDPAEEFRRRFQRERNAYRGKRRSVVRWLVILVLVVYVYLYLSGVIR